MSHLGYYYLDPGILYPLCSRAMDHGNFIDLLGTHADIASRLSELSKAPLERDAVRKWRTQGIPWRWRPYLVAMAREKGVATPSDLLPGVFAE